MLTIGDQHPRLGRRDFLRIGSMSLAGMSLPQALASGALAGDVQRGVTGKSVILLFMHGGPSQTETFDPKMSAPAGVRSVTGEVATNLPGVTYGGTFSRLAQLADRCAIVRSFVTGNGNHDIKPVVDRQTLGASLGAIYSRVAGASNPVTGVPSNVTLFPRAVDPETQKANFTFGDFLATGSLGSACKPFVPGDGGQLQNDMRLALPLNRLSDRRQLLTRLDQTKWDIERLASLGGLDRFRQQAFDALLGGVAEAFDLSKEDPRTLARYDTSTLVRHENISRRWNNHNNYADNARSLGKLLLLARRLCEAGCGFVTVTTNFVWDMHADQNNAGMHEGMEYMGRPFDHAVSAFIEDVAARGLSDQIMLVACGEMGRTPRINKNGGRDHWGRLAPLLLSGGGWQMGQVIGQSDHQAAEPSSEPVTIQQLVSTIMHTVLDVGTVRVLPGVPNEISRQMTGWPAIAGL